MGLESRLGDNILTTVADKFINWGRKNSLWPLTFGTACCGIELMSSIALRYDISRFGAEVLRFSPRQADLLVVAGRIVIKMGPVLRKIYDQMLEPKWVMALGACATSGGLFNTYGVIQGIDQFVPVDIYVPGCPPKPEDILNGLLKLQKKIERDTVLARGR